MAAEASLTAWWNGEVDDKGEPFYAIDVSPNGTNKGAMFGDLPGTNLVPEGGEQAFLFNSGDQDSRYINVPHDESLSTAGEHTIAARVKWTGIPGGDGQDTLLSKGPSNRATYALHVTAEGKIKYTVYREYFHKCSACWLFCCGDSCCADPGRKRAPLECVTDSSIAPNEWVHVAATYDDHIMRVYLNGTRACEQSAYHRWKGSGYQTHWLIPERLVENADDLTIGRALDGTSSWPFRGMMDDIQFFKVALDAEKIANLSSSGTCEPEP
jgi:hypothetical protein